MEETILAAQLDPSETVFRVLSTSPSEWSTRWRIISSVRLAGSVRSFPPQSGVVDPVVADALGVIGDYVRGHSIGGGALGGFASGGAERRGRQKRRRSCHHRSYRLYFLLPRYNSSPGAIRRFEPCVPAIPLQLRARGHIWDCGNYSGVCYGSYPL